MADMSGLESVQQDSIVVQHADYHGHRPKFEHDKVLALDSGRMIMSSSLLLWVELLARIRAALRRSVLPKPLPKIENPRIEASISRGG